MDSATGYPVFTSKLAQLQDLIQKHYNIPYHDPEKYRIFAVGAHLLPSDEVQGSSAEGRASISRQDRHQRS